MGNTCCGNNNNEIANTLYGYMYNSKIRKLKFSHAKVIIDRTFLPLTLHTRITVDELLGLNTVISNQLRKILLDFYIDKAYIDDDYQRQEIYITSVFNLFTPNKYLLLFIFFSLYSNDENKLNLFLPMLLLYSHNTRLNYIEFYQYVREYLSINIVIAHKVNKGVIDMASEDMERCDDIFTTANLEKFMRKIFTRFESKYLLHAESYFDITITQQHVGEIFGRFSPAIFDFFEIQQTFLEALDD
jgi:hypothetical protein